MKTESVRADRPKKNKKKQKKSKAVLWIALGIGGGVLLLIGITTLVVLARPWEWGAPKKIEAAQNNPPEQRGRPGDVIREPTTTLGKARARANRLKLDNDMRQLSLFHRQYCEEVKNPAARTVESFLNYMMRDSNELYNAVKVEKTFTMNPRARPGTEDIVVYETEPYSDGYCCVRANNDGSVVVSAQELKAGMP